MLAGKRILLGIGGGIAVYRVAELARMLVKQGATVRCVMTPAACRFVTPLTFEALTGEKVYTELFDLTAEREMGHIRLARWADVLVIAPATANLLAELAAGLVGSALTAVACASRAPVGGAGAVNLKIVNDQLGPGHWASPPAVPLTTVAAQNTAWRDAAVTVATGAGVTVSVIAVDGTATGATLAASSSTTVIVPAGKTITLTYAGGTPTWVWNLL